MRSDHQKRVDEFMKLAGQDCLTAPTVPTLEVRRLRAALILEEALETIDALGFCAEVKIKDGMQIMTKPLLIQHDRGPNLIEIADGCADLSVVTIGTLTACGISDIPLLEEVDRSNLAKFGLPRCDHCGHEMLPTGVGHNCSCNCGHGYLVQEGYMRDDGKWIKPSNWKPPDIAKVLFKQTVVIDQNSVVFTKHPPELTLIRHPIKSSNIVSAGYLNGVLEVEFSGGGVYRYLDVPKDVHEEFMMAESKGSFLNKYVKPGFKCQRITP